MPTRVPLRTKRKKVKIQNQMAGTTREDPSQTPSATFEAILTDRTRRIEELSDAEDEYEDMGPIVSDEEVLNIAYLKSVTCPIRDGLDTESSKVQDETLEVVLPFLEGNVNEFPLNPFGLPELQRDKHIAFLKQTLGRYPAQMVPMDASRPWLVYWSLQGLSAMGHEISEYRER
jgi:protein farnesyltransferase subunit beta